MTQKEKPAVASGGLGSGLRTAASLPRAHCSASGGNGQVVYAQGRVVGCVVDGWLVKTGLDPARHKVRVPPGWATDTAHLLLPGLRGVRLVLVDGTTFEAPIGLWQRHGLRRFADQTELIDQYWSVSRPGETRAEQLSLFGEGAP